MVVNYNLVVDFARPNKSNTILIAENDVNSRNCRFKLLADKQPFDMTGVVSATVQGVLPSGSIIIGDATIVQDEDENNINEVTYLIPVAATDMPGTVTMTITLADDLGTRITSFEFYLKVRNTLYNEDDYISDDDMSGFRDLLTRARAALARMEQMVEHDALPNPYPLRIEVDGVEYEYTGENIVEIFMGDVAYLGELTGEVEITADDTSAAQAAASAAAAAESLEACEGKYAEITSIINDFEDKIPTARVDKDTTTHESTITIKDQYGTTSTVVIDGVVGSTWYTGTDLIGTTSSQTGVAGLEGDFYVNPVSNNVYRCVTSGDETTAVWDWLLTMTGGTTPYDAGTGIDITSGVISLDYDSSIESGGTKPVSSGTIHTELATNYYTKAQVDDIDKPFVRYGGAKTWSQITSALLIADNDNKFFMVTDGGIIAAADASNWVLPVGTHIAKDSHIAVINTGTAESPVYKFDDFGGGIESDFYLEISNTSSTTYTFTNDVITANSVITPYDDTSGEGAKIAINGTNHTCTITYPTAKTRTVRIYIK